MNFEIIKTIKEMRINYSSKYSVRPKQWNNSSLWEWNQFVVNN